jgi:hypothetical protein
MLLPDEKEKLERGLSDGEASLALEGLKPSAFGLLLKERVLAGEISLDQAAAELRAHYIPSAVASPKPQPKRCSRRGR